MEFQIDCKGAESIPSYLACIAEPEGNRKVM